MNSYWTYIILSQLTGRPLLAIAILFGGGWALDHFTLGVLPSPLRHFRRWQRTGALARELVINPHNRKVRFELADILCDQHRYAAALETLKPNVEHGDDDAGTFYLMGRAATGSGHPKEGETFLTEAQTGDPEFRMGAIALELGRGRLRQKSFTEAKDALEDFCRRRPGTVEGRVLLARALVGLGDEAGAKQVRGQAWTEYASSPAFRRRQERWWAWRLQPWRPVALAFLTLALAFGLVRGLASYRPQPGAFANGVTSDPQADEPGQPPGS